ncbi:DUF2470 domain-containing protein [Streptomyces sp. NPDC059740]|uniref:DUF2470 domain-containing protein n=1 Tax=Streptomyces sp. NPDC059740 TaxID=3346926 RepID=UPI003648074F
MGSLSVPGVPEDASPGGCDGAFGPRCWALTPSADVLLVVPSSCPAARAALRAKDDDLTAVMELTDVAPVSVPHRIRGRAWIAGWLTPLPAAERAQAVQLLAERAPVGELLDMVPEAAVDGGAAVAPWTILRLEVGEATVDDLWGAETVEPEDFAEAAPDPFAAHEAELLQHLYAHHGQDVGSLCSLLGERSWAVCGTEGDAVPVALDRLGLRVRFTDGRQPLFDARFDFPEPVTDLTGLRRAMHRLFEAAATA